MEGNSKYPRQRVAGREHIPLYPKGFIAIRVVQLILALIITALCAFGIYLLPFSGNCLMIFVSISTMIVTIWLIVAEFGIPKVYNYWAVLALDIFLVIFWLCSFALLASNVAYLFDSSVCDYYGYCYSSTPTGLYLVFTACMAAAAGIGGLEFALFVASMAIHSVMLHRHRKAGLRCNPVSFGSAPVVTSHIMPEKNTAQVTTNPAYQPVQAQSAPPYMHQDTSYNNQMVPHQPQQHHAPAPQQQMFAPAPVQPQQQLQPQQQNYYPQPSPTPLSAQHTGGSFAPMQPAQSAVPPMPNAHEVSGNMHHSH
ncbi:integral membrane protein [Colletotrichum tofieldiae]|uniref:Integral membrane protein n=1 Tax=Colletotrichum tofieldiae TaxID=708197 RepID=A0A161YPC4_9PEZI|nr:integral membrane protein [Colletotrichum tofieldiae]